MIRHDSILDQLGGNSFIAMTGAKDFVRGHSSLTFSIPKALRGINRVRITLNERDLYDVTFFKYSPRTLDLKEIETFSDAYAGDLRDLFRNTTGLEVSL